MRCLVSATFFMCALAASSRAATFAVGERSLDVALELAQPTMMVSEPVFATVRFSASHGDVELEASWMGRNGLGRPDNYTLVFIDRAGKALRTPDAGPQFGGLSWHEQLGKRDYRAKLLLPNWVEGLTPGHYTLRVATRVRARVPGAATWQTIDVAVEAAIEVGPDEPAAIARVLGALGDRAIGNTDDASEAMRQLATMHDVRAIPQWLRVMAIAEYEHRFAAVEALADYDDATALSAIISVAGTKPDDLPAEGYTTEALRAESAAQLRVAAAQCLARSRNPRAWPALLAMRADAHYAVRLTVAQRAAEQGDAEALPILRAFASDPNPTIAAEARRLLDERHAR